MSTSSICVSHERKHTHIWEGVYTYWTFLWQNKRCRVVLWEQWLFPERLSCDHGGCELKQPFLWSCVFSWKNDKEKKKHVMVTQSYVSFKFLSKCVHFKRNDSVLVVSDFFLNQVFKLKWKICRCYNFCNEPRRSHYLKTSEMIFVVILTDVN